MAAGNLYLEFDGVLEERCHKKPDFHQKKNTKPQTEESGIWNVVAGQKQARMKLEELRGLFPNIREINLFLVQSKKMFWISKINQNNWEIRAKWNIATCSYYLRGNCRKEGGCKNLHICKDYLFGDKHCATSSCNFSHNIMDIHNLAVLQSLNMPTFNISIIRNSFPRLCGSLLDTGKCTKLFCGYLHLSYKHLTNTCNDSPCELALKSGLSNVHELQSQHNQLVLDQFQLSKANDQTILNSILYPPTTKTIKKNFSMCKFYLDGDCNMGKKCQHLHMCKIFLLPVKKCLEGKCEKGLSHDPLDEHNKSIVTQRNLLHLEKQALINLLKESFPKICRAYQRKEQCCQCKRIHICPDYLGPGCQKLNCNLSHNYKDDHNGNVLSSYGFTALLKPNVKEEYIKANILWSPGTATKSSVSSAAISMPQTTNESGNDFEHEKSFNPLKDEAICREHLEGNCSMSCGFLHSSILSPYLWQKRQKGSNIWQELSRRDNENVEKQFCDPNKESCNIGSDSIEFQCECDGIFRTWTAITEFRRLSTKSSILGKQGDNHLTEWKWYWKEKENDWREYTTGIISSDIERRFLMHKGTESATVIHFSNKQFTYELNFGKKTQKNLDPRYRTEREIRRRPVFSSVRIQMPIQINKEDVFNFLINTFSNGCAAINDRSLLSFFGAEEAAVTTWFSKEKSNFRLSQHKNGDISVSVFDINIDPCQTFWGQNGCDKEDCGRFHICKKMVLQMPHNKYTCTFSHEFSTINNDKLIEENNLADLTNDQIMVILRNRYPRVCEEYQTNQCSEGSSFCQKLHICVKYIHGHCKKAEAICGLLHESGLFGKQSARLRKEFKLEEGCFPWCLYYEDIALAPSTVTDGNTFNPLKEEAICNSYISGNCKTKNCILLHPRIICPYLWQEKRKDTDAWEDFPQDRNDNFEERFCHQNCDAINFTSGNDMKFEEEKNGIFSINASNKDIRRLSTKSSVLARPGEKDLTEWKWYWKEKDGDWREYKSDISSSQIEVAYLKANGGSPANSIKFSTNQFSYEIDFVKMKQKNLDPRYGTEREIRRRPVFSSVTAKDSAQIHFSVPSHWPSPCKPGTRIPISDPAKLSKLKAFFAASIGSHRSIVSIEEVCNVNLFQIYQSKKMLMEKNGASSNEKWLFHGSISTVISDICAQNLDWRLCGLNGTAFGQGTYFARDSSYSDAYSKPDSSGYKYMFIAQVLVGQFTTGSRSYKRPPVRDHSTSELFDSVVNSVSNPSIFVIFERNQCYPRYLVKYR